MTVPYAQPRHATRERRANWIGLLFLPTIAQAFRIHLPLPSQPPVKELEQIAKLSGIEPEKLLIVDVSGVLSKLTFRTRASLLLTEVKFETEPILDADVFYAEDLMRKIRPFLLDVLAAPLMIAIVSKFRHHRHEVDFHQNIRHKCLVHLLYRDEKEPPSSPFTDFGVAVLQWWPTHTSFTCRRRNDVLSWQEWKLVDKPAECFKLEPVPFKLERISYMPLSGHFEGQSLFVYLRLSFRFNISLVDYKPQIHSVITRFPKTENFLYHHTAANNMVYTTDFSNCYTGVIVRGRSVLSFLATFTPMVWVIFISNATILSLLWKQAERLRAIETFFTVLFNCVSATSMSLGSEKHSAFLIASLALVMNFFVSKFFNNDVTSRFLDPIQPAPVTGYVVCQLGFKCPSRDLPRYALSDKKAVCGLNQGHIEQAGMPFQRIRYRYTHEVLQNTVTNYEHWERADGAYLDVGPAPMRKHWKKKALLSVLPRTLTQKSVDFTRIREHGLIVMKKFRPGFLKSPETLYVIVRNSYRVEHYTESNVSGQLFEKYDGGSFDLEGFKAILPFPLLSAAICVLLVFLEKLKSVDISKALESCWLHTASEREGQGEETPVDRSAPPDAHWKILSRRTLHLSNDDHEPKVLTVISRELAETSTNDVAVGNLSQSELPISEG